MSVANAYDGGPLSENDDRQMSSVRRGSDGGVTSVLVRVKNPQVPAIEFELVEFDPATGAPHRRETWCAVGGGVWTVPKRIEVWRDGGPPNWQSIGTETKWIIQE